MEKHLYPVPGKPCSVMIDLDDRQPLTEEEVEALAQELHRQLSARGKLNASIKKINQRLVLSGEEKVQAMREKEDNGTKS